MGNDQINLKKARILNNDAYAESIEEFSEKYCNTEDSLFAKTQTNADFFNLLEYTCLISVSLFQPNELHVVPTFEGTRRKKITFNADNEGVHYLTPSST